jgi:hypothetical protein
MHVQLLPKGRRQGQIPDGARRTAHSAQRTAHSTQHAVTQYTQLDKYKLLLFKTVF